MTEQLDERAIFIRGPVVIFKWRNTEGWPVEYVSPNAGEVFGYTPDQFLTGEVAYASLIHEADLGRVADEVSAAAEGTDSSFVHEPYRVRHRDGSLRWLHDVTQIQRPVEGEPPSHFVGYVVDITARMTAEHDRRSLERKLLHTQKLESLGVLAGGVAHDFNNLLTGILGEASLAELEVEPDQKTLARSLRIIQGLARRAADLTQQLLAYSGKGQFIEAPVDLTNLVEEILAMLETVISKKAKLSLQLDPVYPIPADPAQLQQVLMNLITNASDALQGKQGTIEIRTRNLEPSNPEGGVELVVSDDGVGMTTDVVAQLYDPFFTTKQTGRGLGMSAVVGIVRSLNGTIAVASEPDCGTTFTVTFRSCDVQPVRTPEIIPQDAWFGEGTVLVVDDEPSVRAVAAKMFEKLGFDVLTAGDGQTGIERFREHQDEIQLVLLDLMMPNVDGVEAMRAIRAIAPRVPIILSSGYSSLDGVVEIEKPEVTAFFQKPYRFADFEGVVRRLLPCPTRLVAHT